MGIIKKVFGASAIIIFANGLNRLFSVLAAPVLTRVLGPCAIWGHGTGRDCCQFGIYV